ncbi:hypothetical protein [Acidocella sp.]|uniref:hypothetical protein n=1 Tax=Acidocella sp. TaxID=50710 RepID=UPI0026339090|nr:hypothetical protein [Acidocella sp.]
MGKVVLTLGGVPFQDMEVPEKICFGGKQRVAVQNLIGGGRVVSALGLDDGEISFAGIFSGADAVARAQELDAARALGAQLPLVWGGFFYIVVIEKFTAEYRKPGLIPFAIDCVVVSDPVAAVAALAAPLANMVGGDLTAAEALSGQAGISLQGVVATSLSGFAAVQQALVGGIGAMGTSLVGAASILGGAVMADAGIGAVSQLSAVSGQLAGAAVMRGYVNRAAINLGASLL